MKINFLYILFYIISLLPIWCLYIISDILYVVLYKIIGYRSDIVFNNLKNSFPEKKEKELRKLQNKFYHHFFDIIIEVIKSISASKKFFNNRIVFKNIDVFNKYNNIKKPVVLAVAHYGNWEWGILGLSISVKQKMTGVYKKLNNSFFNNVMNNIRSRFGANLLEMNDTFRYVVAQKEECEIIGLLSDQSPVKNESNYWTTFLNQETSVYLGAEKIASKMDYAVPRVDL